MNKNKIHETCLTLLATKTRDLEARIAAIQESKNNETKSSAGDKYETGRAMMQMEEDKILAQLDLAKYNESQLRQLDLSTFTPIIRLGNLVISNQRNYFLSIALGKVMVEDKAYYCISTDSPIGQLLLGQKQGDQIVFNGNQEEIMAVY